MRNWAGNVRYSADRLVRPTSVTELQETVARTARIRALGTGHSFNRIADTTGTLVSTADLDLAVELDESTRTVLVPAGARYGTVAAFLERRGWALHNLGSLPHISVAGACATGTHGSGDGNRCLAAAVQGIEFVRANGELVTRTAADADFGGSVLALGALGIATRLRLAVQPSYQLRQDVWLDLPTDVFAERFAEIMSAGYSVSVFTDWSRPGVLDSVWVKSRVDGPLVDGTRWSAHSATTAQHPIPGHDPAPATEQLGRPGAWHERLPHFRAEHTPSSGAEQQSEYLLPRAAGPAAVEALRTVDLGGALQVCEIRTVAADDLWLSPCAGRDTVGIHFTWIDDDRAVDRAVAAVEDALAGFDPRPHWAKVFGSVAGTGLARHYPRLPEFRQLIDQHDPTHKFGNDFLEQYVY